MGSFRDFMREPQKVEAVSACRSCGKPIERRGQLWYVTGSGPVSDICLKERSGCHKPVGTSQRGHATKRSARASDLTAQEIKEALSDYGYPVRTGFQHPNSARRVKGGWEATSFHREGVETSSGHSTERAALQDLARKLGVLK